MTLVLSWGFHGMFCTPDVPLEVPLLADSNISLLGGPHENIRFFKLAGYVLEIVFFLPFVLHPIGQFYMTSAAHHMDCFKAWLFTMRTKQTNLICCDSTNQPTNNHHLLFSFPCYISLLIQTGLCLFSAGNLASETVWPAW